MQRRYQCTSNASVALLPDGFDGGKIVQGDAGFVDTPVRVPSTSTLLVVPQGTSRLRRPLAPTTYATAPPPSPSSSTSSSSSSTTTTSHHYINAPSLPNPTFLPTPPPEPHAALPNCDPNAAVPFTIAVIPEFDFCGFERRDVYPYGVETPGLTNHVGEDDYFGKS